jgi:hypothetical protein
MFALNFFGADATDSTSWFLHLDERENPLTETLRTAEVVKTADGWKHLKTWGRRADALLEIPIIDMFIVGVLWVVLDLVLTLDSRSQEWYLTFVKNEVLLKQVTNVETPWSAIALCDDSVPPSTSDDEINDLGHPFVVDRL